MRNAVICGYKRSAFTPAFKGEFALLNTRPDDLVAAVIKALVSDTGVKPEDIEDIKLGCAFPEGEQGLNMGRMVAFLADLPISVAGNTINRWCGSSMNSVHDAVGAIAAGAGDVFIAAGVEGMSKVPMPGLNPLPNPDLFERWPETYESMGITAENLAKKHSISRADQEAFAVNSHQKAAAADYSKEIVAIENVVKDGCVRPDTTTDALASLKPSFDAHGSVTAGTSSPLTDGATAVLVASEDYAKKHNLPILARVKSMAVAGCAPELMGIGPVPATEKALARAGLSISDIDFIELNEAFAAQVLAVVKEGGFDINKLNIEGGAIALGHPLGASGARITGMAAKHLSNHGKKYALATACIGGGMGIATILEAV